MPAGVVRGVWCVVCGVSIIYMLYCYTVTRTKSTITKTRQDKTRLSDNKHCQGLEVLSQPSYLFCVSVSLSVPISQLVGGELQGVSQTTYSLSLSLASWYKPNTSCLNCFSRLSSHARPGKSGWKSQHCSIQRVDSSEYARNPGWARRRAKQLYLFSQLELEGFTS